MENNFTNTEFRAGLFGFLFAAIIFIALISFSGCSSGIEHNNISNNASDQSGYVGDKSFSFKNEGSNWRVDFDNDQISALFKDGTRIPDNEVERHKEMIYEKLDGLKSDYKDLNGKVHRFHFDVDEFADKMKKFKDNFDDEKFMRFKLEFDEDEIEKNMEELKETLKELKDKKIEIHFDSEKFKDHMKELDEHLKDLPDHHNKADVDIYLDMDDFKAGMKNLGESFKQFDFKFDSSDFDISELKESMKELKKNLKGLKIEIHDNKGELKKLNLFLDDLKSELEKDGYIKSEEDDFNLEMSPEKTLIQNIEVKKEDHKKYKELYKKHFDKEIDGTIKIDRD